MKKLILTTALALTAALMPSASFGQPALTEEIGALAPVALPRRVAVGMTRGELILSAGTPDATLDANVWAYWQFRTTGVPADKNHDALLVVFERDRVKFFKFCAREPVQAFVARQKIAATRPIVAAQ